MDFDNDNQRWEVIAHLKIYRLNVIALENNISNQVAFILQKSSTSTL